MAKARAIESPGYSLSSKIDELHTQSRSKRSNYEYGNESKEPLSQKQVERFTNNHHYEEDPEIEDNFNEDNFIFSLPPDDDDNYSSYSLITNNLVQRTPMTEFDIAASEGGDQIDLLMNGYNNHPVRGNLNSIPMSDLTTSMGIGYSPHVKNVYMVTKDENASGVIQSGNYPSQDYQGPAQADVYYASGPPNNYNYQGYTSQNRQQHTPKVASQGRGRQLSSNAIAGKMLTTHKNETERSFGNYNK